MSLEDKHLVDLSGEHVQPSIPSISNQIGVETTKPCETGSEMSSSDQTTSDEATNTESSENTSRSASESDSTDSESTSSDDSLSEAGNTSEESIGVGTRLVKDTVQIKPLPKDLVSLLRDILSSSAVSNGMVTTREGKPGQLTIVAESAKTNSKEHSTSLSDTKSLGHSSPDTTVGVHPAKSDITHFQPKANRNDRGLNESLASDTPQTNSTHSEHKVLREAPETTSPNSSTPPQLTGGWGEEPGPAPWEWQQMPFDYMGILDEQHRTVFYEFHERNGKGEWTLPNYEGQTREIGLMLDEQCDYAKDKFDKNIIRGSKKHRGGIMSRGTVHRFWNHGQDDRGEDVLEKSISGRAKRHAPYLFSRVTHRKVDNSHQDPFDTLAHGEVYFHSIIDAPNEPSDTIGLIPPNPNRPSIHMVETKDEAKKSNNWTKEGKREREMSSLVLPRPERKAMTAAILPRPDKKVKVKKEEERECISEYGKNNAKGKEDPFPVIESGKMDKIPTSVDMHATPSTDYSQSHRTAFSFEPAQAPAIVSTGSFDTSNAEQILLQLITLLRSDEKALSALKGIVNTLAPSDVLPATTTVLTSTNITLPQPNTSRHSIGNVDPIRVDPADQSEAGSPVEKPQQTLVAKSDPQPGLVEALMKPSSKFYDDKVAEANNSPTTEEPGEVAVCPKLRYKLNRNTEKSKSNDKSHKFGSKDSNHSKHSSDTHVSRKLVARKSASIGSGKLAAAPFAVYDDNLTDDEFWYSIPDAADDDIQTETRSPKGTYTLEDLRRYCPRPVTGRLYEPPSFSPFTKPPTNVVEFQPNPGTGALEAYNKTFQKVDAADDLGITSKPNVNGYRKEASKLREPIETIPTEASPSGKQENLRKSGVKASIATYVNTNGNDLNSVSLNTTPKQPRHTPLHYGFNPPSPRRVLRRVVLNPKETGTQTTPPSTPICLDRKSRHSPVRSESAHISVHHSNCYNANRNTTTHIYPRKAPPYTPETLPEWAKSNTGSDMALMGTWKNVDATDDLMIVSSPKGEKQAETKLSVDMEVAKPTPQSSESIAKPVIQDENGLLYALLAAISKSSQPSQSPETVDRKRKKNKKERKEKRPDKERTSRNERSKSKSTKPINVPGFASDIFGDLLSEEIPKWDILNPSEGACE